MDKQDQFYTDLITKINTVSTDILKQAEIDKKEIGIRAQKTIHTFNHELFILNLNSNESPHSKFIDILKTITSLRFEFWLQKFLARSSRIPEEVLALR